jgi:hypothetical protein
MTITIVMTFELNFYVLPTGHLDFFFSIAQYNGMLDLYNMVVE